MGSVFAYPLKIACTTRMLIHLFLSPNSPTLVWRVRPHRMSTPNMNSGIGVINTLHPQGGRCPIPSFTHVWVTEIICPPNPPVIALVPKNVFGSPFIIDVSASVSTSAIVLNILSGPVSCYFNLGPLVPSRGPSPEGFGLTFHAISLAIPKSISSNVLARAARCGLHFFDGTMKSSRFHVSRGICSMIPTSSPLGKD